MSRFIDPDAPPAEVAPSEGDRTYSMLIHLSGFLSYAIGPFALIVTLVLWLARKDDSAFINDHGREAMNYNISIWLYAAIICLLVLVTIGLCFIPALVIFDIIVVILAAVRASSGAYYRYPVTIRFISG